MTTDQQGGESAMKTRHMCIIEGVDKNGQEGYPGDRGIVAVCLDTGVESWPMAYEGSSGDRPRDILQRALRRLSVRCPNASHRVLK